ncbi:nucleoside deaminase [Nitratireductor soli]|uniref:nucleoside deaminase n=1 Tax=Nitratireductor soli TaxID=1670619 RepID=UPI00065DD931|nr:nucleoside deaminase [Nitratireductor soli]
MCAGPASRYQKLMEETVAYSMDHVHDGGIPFTALVVDRNGTILGRGVNRVREHHDPTAHAEVEAIRDACHTHGTPNLSGATLLASGEPCAMCYMSARFAGIARVVFAADRHEAAEHGFDYRGTYRLFADDPLHWQAPSVEKLPVPERLAPFQSFRSRLRVL